ncbi:DUF885 family protein [Emticicia sp. BO119]|uniref:DUF885 domain-containing protein n=1 Tax=Emticicia sp. BO119 TaxID=2757768 RepID=UPI0015F063F2|nr:DUF885 domain-containing protein [Emticicia sp. BO119]MBA4852211.1 DUF885 domain-containing protein [Emticicia sp. BO119]
MKKYFFIISICLIASSAFSQNKIENVTIISVLDEIHEFNRQESAADSIYPFGRNREEDFSRKYQFYKKESDKLNGVSEKSLGFNDQINMALLKYIVNDELISYEYKEYLNPILSDAGFHTGLPGMGSRTYSTKKEIERYLNSLRGISLFVDENLELMRKGLSLGISQPSIALNGYEATYNSQIVDNYEQSAFWQPFKEKPAAITEADWKQLKAEGKKQIEQSVIPSYRKIRDFFEKEYHPKTRATLGASHFPNGKKYYAEKVKHYTTTNMTPDEVYDTGMKEVKRIRKEMQQILDDVKFKGSFKDFINYLRNDPKFYPTTGEQLLKEASFIAKKIDGKLPLLFGKLPRQPYGVVQVPDYLAPTYTAGRYSGANIKSKNSGNYWVNLYNLPSRTLYTLEALTLHEAVPGHHLQIALTQELENLPEFRRNLYVNAYGEGWGLYGEYLGYELGLYKDPYSLFGRLTYEMWRACRLVIDVGIHDRDWTRDQAVNFLADNTALSLHEVNTEINRYISWPGQALAYKIGEITIKTQRQKAQERLGPKFDVRSFHDLVLSQGTVTMSILEKMVDKYIDEELNKKPKE